MLSQYYDTNGTWEIEDADLIYTYVHDPASVAGAPLADLAGTNPSTGMPRYYFGDNLGSTRRLRDASKTSLGAYEYKPYGEMYAESGATPKYKFAGMYYPPDLGTYYTLNRFYNPTLARWMTRDPLGMVDGANLYAYVKADPVGGVDSLGASRYEPGEVVRVYRGKLYNRTPWKKALSKLFIPAACVTCATGLLGLEAIALVEGAPHDHGAGE